MRLEQKLGLFIIPTCLLPIVLIGAIAFIEVERSTLRAQNQELNNLVSQTSDRIEREMTTARANIELFAGSQFLARYLLADDEETRYALLQPRLLEFFAQYQRAYPNYVEIRLLDENGFAETDLALPDWTNSVQDLSREPLFRSLSSGRRDTRIVVARRPGDSRPVMEVGRRVVLTDPGLPISDDEVTKGFLTITVDLAFVKELLDHVQLGAGGSLFITDDTGKPWFPNEMLGTMPLPAEVIAATQDSPTEVELTGGSTLLLGRKIHPDLHLFAAVPKAQLQKSRRKLELMVALGMALAALMTYLVVFGLLRRFIVRPLETLKRAADQMTAGHYRVQTRLTTKDEIGDLARILEDLGVRVESSQRLLEVRAHELAESVGGLREAKDRAELASRAKSDFLARMSHEIRTPMNGVLGLTELMLSSTQLDDRQKRYAKNIHHSAESLLTVINDILDFSKVEAGKLELDHAPFDVREIIEDAVDLFAERAQDKGLHLFAVVPPPLHVARIGDGGRLRQVLVNLIGNAVKFTQHGEIEVSVHDGVNGAPDAVRFEVRDTGIGIRHENQQAIFDSFAQEDGSVTRQYGGTGLGLAICRQLIGLMGGDIEVASEPGKGSTFAFTVTLPRDCAGVAAEDNRAFLGKRALVLDDHPINRDILTEQLGFLGMSVTLADSGRDALEAVRSQAPFDVALLDMQMPSMDGIEVARAIRRLPNGARTVLLVMSSATTVSVADVWAELGVGAAITKPIRRRQLITVLKSLISGDTLVRPTRSVIQTTDAALGLRVLVAEDNPVNQEVVAEMLGHLGCRVKIAKDGRACVDLVAAHTFDVVLMDCQMPLMDGFAAARQIREGERLSNRPRLPIIALTANAIEGDRERCIEAGMDDYLSKPFTMDQLRATLLAWSVPRDALPMAEAAIETGIDESPLDENVVAGLAGITHKSGTRLLDRVAAIYLESGFALVEGLVEAIRTGDAEAVGAKAHALKSSSANVGAIRFAALCADLERLARTGSVASSGSPYSDRLIEEYRRVAAALRAKISHAATVPGRPSHEQPPSAGNAGSSA